MNSYIRKVSFFLSFIYKDYDRDRIIEDYEEWILNEINSGRSYSEILVELGSPLKLTRTIIREQGREYGLIDVLKNEQRFKGLLIFFILYIISYIAFRKISNFGYEYFFFAAVQILLIFLLYKVSMFEQRDNYIDIIKIHAIFIVSSAILEIANIAVIGNKISQIGILYTGLLKICVVISAAFSLIIFVAKKNMFINFFLLNGMIQLLLYSVNMFGQMSPSIETFIAESLVLFSQLTLEILILSITLYLLNTAEARKEKNVRWIHN